MIYDFDSALRLAVCFSAEFTARNLHNSLVIQLTHNRKYSNAAPDLLFPESSLPSLSTIPALSDRSRS